jgi:hypothetical protein
MKPRVQVNSHALTVEGGGHNLSTLQCFNAWASCDNFVWEKVVRCGKIFV